MDIEGNKLIGAIVMSPIIYLTKMSHKKILDNHDLFLKCFNEGLYHITNINNIEKIMESGHLKSSGVFKSYGQRKTFFFAGVPSIEDLCINLDFQTRLVALKINPTYDDLAQFDFRNKNDESIIYNGNLKINDKQIEVVYLCLYKEKGNFIYRRVNFEEYNNYKPNFNEFDLNNTILNRLKGYTIGIQKEYEYFKKEILNKKFSLTNELNKEVESCDKVL
ncbi:MAG: hypothetical protein PHN42_03785 [Bacilli bacterium]|nr:hypothetical protein [Bacilli bacterium]